MEDDSDSGIESTQNRNVVMSKKVEERKCSPDEKLKIQYTRSLEQNTNEFTEHMNDNGTYRKSCKVKITDSHM